MRRGDKAMCSSLTGYLQSIDRNQWLLQGGAVRPGSSKDLGADRTTWNDMDPGNREPFVSVAFPCSKRRRSHENCSLYPVCVDVAPFGSPG